ncbi:MAG TPA: hypothetical protein VGN63_03705 [Flavisolibacter sp.]|jgi:hypothetical protein|nr:hypothetical protein [Flavisolibacter sp.]
MRIKNRIYYDEFAQEILLVLVVGFLFLQNGFYLFTAFLVFAYIFSRLQQPGKPTIFTLVFIYHFIQVIAYILLCMYLGEELNFRSPSMGKAILASLGCFFFLFGPIIYYQNKLPNVSIDTLRHHARQLSIRRTFYAYLIAYFVVNTLVVIALGLGGLAQVTFSLINLKWVLFTLFGLQATLTGRMKREFYGVIALEFATGFFSFFSNFKVVIFFVAFIYLIYVQRVYFKHVITTIVVIAFAFTLGVMWTSIKQEYRKFLNGGTKGQVVTVSQDEALEKIWELSSNQDRSGFDASVEHFLLRLQYVYHLAKTMDRVPSVIPHQQGANWGTTLEFALTPRALNPNKPIYNATEKTTHYTGIRYSGARSGASFSLGYFGDSYIDFGVMGMWIPLLLLGFLYGAMYFYFLRSCSDNFVFNYAVVAGMFMEFAAFEMDSTYLTGRLFSTLLVFTLLRVYFFPKFYKHIRLEAYTPPKKWGAWRKEKDRVPALAVGEEGKNE